MRKPEWLCDLNRLIATFPSLGIGPDLAALGLCELWGLYCYLRGLSGE